MSRTILALIPAYEPSLLLPILARQLHENGVAVIIVDDGSGAGFDDVFVAAARYATVLKHDKNRGKGAALKTGLAYIRGHFSLDSCVVTLDSDGQHNVSDALMCAVQAARHPDSLILGCRDFDSDTVPFLSRLQNRVTRFLFFLASGHSIADTQSGLRAFSQDLIPMLLKIPGERYDYEMNVLLACARKKVPVEERSIQTIFYQHNAGSHFRVLKDSLRIYAGILGWRFQHV